MNTVYIALVYSFKKEFQATMVLESGIPYRMKYVVVKLCLCLISLFQPIDQMSYNNLFSLGC